MTYEIEGELEDPNTGEKLPFKAKYRFVCQTSHLGAGKLHTDLINKVLKDETDDKCNNEHKDGATA